jgi:hypothetical protein
MSISVDLEGNMSCKYHYVIIGECRHIYGV